MVGEFRSKPQPGDWTLPEEVAAGLDPLAQAVLSEHEYNGMPIPFGFQFVINNGDLFGRVQSGDLEAATAVRGQISEAEERFPDSPGWDGLRYYVAELLLASGQQEEALATIWDIKEPHRLIDALFKHAEATDAPPDILTDILNLPDTDRKFGLLRAVRDRMIDDGDVEGDSFAIIADYILEEGAEADPVDGWAESQGSVYPEVDWPSTVAILRDESQWNGLPMPLRQHVAMTGLLINKSLADPEESITEAVDYLVQVIDYWREKHPNTPYWDNWAAISAVNTIQRDTVAATRLSDCIKDDRFKASVAMEYIPLDKAEEAMALILSMRKYSLAAQLLMFGPWTDAYAPLRQLQDVMINDSYPTEQRIGFIEFVRDQMIAQDNLAGAVKYDEMLLQLRDQ